MHSHLIKELFDDVCVKVEECVILSSKSVHISLKPEETIYFYIVSGWATMYELDSQLNITTTSTLAPGQILKVDPKEIKTVLIEALGSFDEDTKILNIKRKFNA